MTVALFEKIVIISFSEFEKRFMKLPREFYIDL